MLRSFRFQLTAAYAGGMLALVGALSWTLADRAADRALDDQSDTLQTLARSTGTMLADGLAERMREVELLAQRRSLQAPGRERELERVEATRSHLSWMGLVTPEGKVVAASSGMLVGSSVAQRPWFRAALNGPYAGDVHTAKLLAGMLPPSPTGEPIRFIDFAAPLRTASGEVVGVLGAHVNWDWTREIVANLRSPHAREHGVRVFILDRAGEVIHRPAGMEVGLKPVRLDPLAGGPGIVEWDDGERYLTAAVALPARNPVTDMGWTIVARQPLEHALAGAREARDTTLAVGGLAALLASVIAWVVAGRLSRPLRKIAAAARGLSAGRLDTPLPRMAASSEVRDLTTALGEMTSALLARERELLRANATLEQRVADRTAELSRASAALRAANAELKKLANRDALTGLPNRRSLDDALQAEVLRHRRSGRPLSLVLADVDHFKRINDTHGHAMGDAVLRAVADALSHACRATDLVGRFGGEEFMILMPETPREGARLKCEKLRAEIEALAGEVPVTISFGLVSPAQYFVSAAEALDAADQALYVAKAQGRNRVGVYDGDTPQRAAASGFIGLEAG